MSACCHVGVAGADCTSNGPSDNQRHAVLRNTTDQTANFEYGNRHHEGRLQMEVLVCFPPRRLERSNGEKEGGPVPADVIEAVEFISDSGDGGCDDGHVECDEENREDEGNDDEGELEGVRIICCGNPGERFHAIVVFCRIILLFAPRYRLRITTALDW